MNLHGLTRLSQAAGPTRPGGLLAPEMELIEHQ